MATRILVVADDVPWRLECAAEVAVGGYVARHIGADAALWDALLATEFVAFVIGPGATSTCDTALVSLLAGFAPDVPRLVVLRPGEGRPDNSSLVLRTDDPPGSVLAAIEMLLGPGVEPARIAAEAVETPSTAPAAARTLGGAGFHRDPPARR